MLSVGNLGSQNVRQCSGCRHFEHEHEDWDTNTPESIYCNAVDFGDDPNDVPPDFAEAVGVAFEAIFFQLSALNNCPLYRPHPPSRRRSILDAVPAEAVAGLDAEPAEADQPAEAEADQTEIDYWRMKENEAYIQGYQAAFKDTLQRVDTSAPILAAQIKNIVMDARYPDLQHKITACISAHLAGIAKDEGMMPVPTPPAE